MPQILSEGLGFLYVEEYQVIESPCPFFALTNANSSNKDNLLKSLNHFFWIHRTIGGLTTISLTKPTVSINTRFFASEKFGDW